MNLKFKTLPIQTAFLCLLCFISVFVTAPVAQAQEAESEKPYKATTVDECIREKECFWYHFLLAIQAEPIHRKPSKSINIKKWEAPVRFRAIEIPADTDKAINEYLQQINTFFLQNISVEKNYNFLIFFTDNIRGELTGRFKSLFDKMLGIDAIEQGYNIQIKSGKEYEKKCYYFHTQESDKNYRIQGYFSFIEKDNPQLSKCLREVVYTGFGLSDISYSPIVQTEYSEQKFTKLELLLIYFLYQDYFKSGMSYDQVQATFDKVYDPFIKILEKQGVFND